MPEPVADWLVSGYRTWLKQPEPRHDYAAMFDLTTDEMAEIRRRNGETSADLDGGSTLCGGGEVDPEPVPAAAPDSESPAVMVEPSGGAHQLGIRAAAIPIEDHVSPFTRRALSLHHKTGCTIEEARHIAALQPVGSDSPSRSVAADREGVTRFPNSRPFRLGAAALPQRAAPSRDRRVFHAPTMHGETGTCPSPRGSESAP